MPVHSKLVGHSRQVDDATWLIWLQASIAYAGATSPGFDIEAAGRTAQATFAEKHPDVVERRALWEQGYTGVVAPAAVAVGRLATYAERQAMQAITDPGDPNATQMEG